MKPERPSNMLIMVFISILAIFGIFVIGALLSTTFKTSDRHLPQLKETGDRLVN
ncbi:MAG TPA: hypothetical protein V6D28_21325 [Leptolyngbyaceae cyanobacterium]